MSVTNPFLSSARANLAEGESVMATVQRISGYAMCVVLAVFSGAVSTAAVMAIAIMIQTVMIPTEIFAPGIVFFAAVSIAVGFGLSWSLAKIGRHILPNSFNQAEGYELLVVTTIGTVASLIQTIMFMFVL